MAVAVAVAAAERSTALAWALSEAAVGRWTGSLASAAANSGASGAGTPARSGRPETMR